MYRRDQARARDASRARPAVSAGAWRSINIDITLYTLPESIVSVFISTIITFIFKKEQQQQ